MSGNAGKGRRPGSRNRLTLATMELMEEGETPCAFALRIMRDNTKSDDFRLQAARIAAPYLHPRPQIEPRLVTFDLPEQIQTSADLMAAHAALLRGIAAGELSLDEAKEISAILDAHRKVIETAGLEERISKLEQSQQGNHR